MMPDATMTKRVALAGAGLLALVLVYLFQRVSYAHAIGSLWMPDPDAMHPNVVFIINRTLRLVVNDLACMLLIFAFFRERRYLVVAFYLFLFELLVVLPGYFAIKLSLEGDAEISSPLLSFAHRLIVNPMLMLILMAGFFYQKFRARSG